MKIEKKDLDLQGLYSRYREGRLELDPDYQRGEVWGPEKKAKLLDTILREWTVPPLHFIKEDNGAFSVLDGLQRLTAIFEFIEGNFRTKSFAPSNPEIDSLSGLRFEQLDDAIRDRIRETTIPSFIISEHTPEEPFELFFRLNSPTGLTQAEKRNALAGRTREQVKELTALAEMCGWSAELIGFSPGRGSYADVIARVGAHVHFNSLDIQMSPNRLEEFYRNAEGMDANVFEIIKQSIATMSDTLRRDSLNVKFNKATLVTWLLVLARAQSSDIDFSHVLAEAISLTERGSKDLRLKSPILGSLPLISLYRDRASLRVTDVLSVKARDVIVSYFIEELVDSPTEVNPATAIVRASLGEYDSEDFSAHLLAAISIPAKWPSIR